MFCRLQKAFDSVLHDGLLFKLLQINVGGCFFNLIKSLYSNSTCSIKIGQNQTGPFSYARGLRQGCILSPLLFNLFTIDIPFSFEKILSDPFVLPNGAKLNSLLYAGHLVILSRSNTLSSYMGFRATLNFRKFKVALNPMYRYFLNFVKSCILSCLSKFYNKRKFHRAVFEK